MAPEIRSEDFLFCSLGGGGRYLLSSLLKAIEYEWEFESRDLPIKHHGLR